MQMDEQRRKVFDNRCSLCKIGEKSIEISSLLSKTETNVPHNENNLNNMLNDDIDVDLNVSLNKLRQENTTIDEWEIDLNNIPNITDASDNLLDADLLLLKFDILNSTSSASAIAGFEWRKGNFVSKRRKSFLNDLNVFIAWKICLFYFKLDCDNNFWTKKKVLINDNNSWECIENIEFVLKDVLKNFS